MQKVEKLISFKKKNIISYLTDNIQPTDSLQITIFICHLRYYKLN